MATKEETSINKKQIEDRINLIEKERENLRATLVAYEGALQESRFWLKSFDKPSETNKE